MKRAWLFLPVLSLALACGDKSEDEDDGDDTASSSDDTGSTTGTEDPLTGEELYRLHCASCHGEDGGGTSSGPGLAGEVSRHSDADLIGVILDGKHDMPAIDVTEDEAGQIVDYLRELFGA